MGNFANTLFSVLLGWVQSAAAWLWSLIASDGGGGLMGWVLDNWLALAIGLCLLGLVVDGVVYLIRWQPYRVWRSNLRRSGAEASPEATPAPAEEPLQWVYANGEVAVQPPETYAPQAETAPEEAGPRRRVIPARRHAEPDSYTGDDQRGYHQPFYPPQWRGGKHQRSDGGTQE